LHNSGIDSRQAIAPRFHPGLPIQAENKVWTFNGTVPPKLVKGRYGEPILFRHHNRLPADVTLNGGFGRHTISTHEHNGHHGSENDGFTGAFFFPGQFYDYHWPIVLAGHFSINSDATDWFASKPVDGPEKLVRVPGDWHETMSTHWFHDHMFSFTEQNVYKGNAGMFNLYSALDRGAEDIFEEFPDGSGRTVNLRLPSGRAEDSGTSWGNLHYDVNLMLADKSWDAEGQLTFDIFNFDGFLGDVMTVNSAYKPYLEVESRKYRFRILNASVARFYKLTLVKEDSTIPEPMIQIANDGNLLPHPVRLFALDELGIAERYDIVIDFSRYECGQHLKLVNLLSHFDDETGSLNGRKPIDTCSIAEALSGASPDPCVGPFLEFRVVRKPAKPDVSRVPDTLIPNPDHTGDVVRQRVFEFGRGADQTTFDPVTSGEGPWGISTDGGRMLTADFGRISAAPRHGSREIWTLRNGGGGWDHPIHIHFEEALILARNGSAAKVPPWERGRKDVFRLHPGESLTISIKFRDWTGMFMEHCHNTTHEDKAMLLRWEIDERKEPILVPLQTPIPTPQGVFFQDPSEILPTASR
jgi:FtsP/CotA-like multicopper oxidase with cupredoxin domain